MTTRFCEACETPFDEPVHAAIHAAGPASVHDAFACTDHGPIVRCPHCGAPVTEAEGSEDAEPRAERDAISRSR